EWFTDLIVDLISEAMDIDIEQLENIVDAPSALMCLPSINLDLPKIGSVTVGLFSHGEHAALDEYMGFAGAPHHYEEPPLPSGCGRLLDTAEFDSQRFQAMRNTLTTAKLVLLDGPQLDQMLKDILHRDISTYHSGDNILVTQTKGTSASWLNLIDGDHAWRQDGQPVFGVRPPMKTGGNGNFPIWESCALRPAFRVLFQDWENPYLNPGSPQFPDLEDAPSPDEDNDPEAPTSKHALTGNVYTQGGQLFVGPGHSFTLTAHDLPAERSFPDSAIGLQRRIYTDPQTAPDFMAAVQGKPFSLQGPDGRYFVEYRSSDPCHTFPTEPLPVGTPEASHTVEAYLDTTAPVVTCNTPPFNRSFTPDETSRVDFGVGDGTLGSGVASVSATINGVLTETGPVPITQGATLDMMQYTPGVHTVAVTAADHLNNSAVTACQFEIHADPSSLRKLVERLLRMGLIRNPGLANSLDTKLREAEASRARGLIHVERNVLEALIHELEAQRGKGINAPRANQLISFIQDLIARGG
ncbi:MAG: FIMAH domain-containing protein, partial [Hyalangium sp.]|uniref:FIMAH domain-containing protein n=1 Tax=Hyalangium sp. TaxID=2028555 RepID=UPI00389997DE